jgi:hypothetical protein
LLSLRLVNAEKEEDKKQDETIEESGRKARRRRTKKEGEGKGPSALREQFSLEVVKPKTWPLVLRFVFS